jgi:hypothetical protein
MTSADCSNLNHRRSAAPVRACPQCGGIVNARIAATRCSPEAHVAKRKKGDAFCFNCAAPLRGK